MIAYNHSSYPACFFPVQSDLSIETIPPLATSAAGYCDDCAETHHLDAGFAHNYALLLMAALRREKRLDLCSAGETVNPSFCTDYLFGEARGQMFGVLLCRHPDGTVGILRAFSCQYNGCWQIPGWVPPLFDVVAMNELVVDIEKEIKHIGRQIERPENQSRCDVLRCQRRDLSRQLMLDIHGMYRLTNFCGVSRELRQVFITRKGIPTGVGDCCAPKLLNYAACHNLTPLGVAEFYWGKENRSATRKHGEFYSACSDKCAPILGFMLCGLQ